MADPNVIKVLVVDDSDIIKHSLRKFLSEYNFEVFVSNDGLEGIEKARTEKPNLILLDLMMPNFDGLKMLQVLKVFDEIKDIPVIVISGNT
ncbi:MAG: response regulator, partial [Ignavibacteria bacterium]